MERDKRDLITLDYWVPTKLAGIKGLRAQIEYLFNQPLEELEGATPYERILDTRDMSVFYNIFPLAKANKFNKEVIKAAPLNRAEFKYNVVYKKSGGLLNLFHPLINKEMDIHFKKLFDESLSKKEVINKWLVEPSQIWSSLTPGQVWAGGGEIEFKLFIDFMNKLTITLGDREYVSEGEALVKSLGFLRSWQLQPNSICNDISPYKAIKKEREEIFLRKINYLKQAEIRSDFYLGSE